MYNPYQNGYQGGYGYQQPYGQPLGAQTTGFYAQNQPQSAPQGPPQQPGLFQGQQTGYQSQYGGQQFQAPGQVPFQAQATGFGAQTYQQAPQNVPPTNFGMPAQQTGFQQQQTPYAPLQQQKTGFLSALASVSQNTELKIPSIRLLFITASDQTKFEHLFRTAVPAGENSLSGDAARDILLRLGLAPVTLAEIWALADTNKLGSLLFPEFALALHLCNALLRGDPLPGVLPAKWQNEVQSFVDAISFAVPEDPSKILANTPFSSFAQNHDDWTAPQSTGPAPPMTSFTAQPTGGFLPSSGPLSAQRTGGGTLIPLQPQQTAGFVPAQAQLQQQRTGGMPGTSFQSATATGGASMQVQSAQATASALQQQSTGFQAQNTGFQQPQRSGYQQIQPQGTGFQQIQPQGTGFQQIQPQGTGFQQIQPQGTGYQQPQPSGFQQQTGLQSQNTGYQATGAPASLQAQPTGKPGQWGFVSTPTGGLPGLNAMQQHFLPSSQLTSNNLQNAMGGTLKTNLTWAITKQEKLIYDGIFAAWDPNRKGFIDGDVAISIFGKSGLARPDLESIWNLCDSSNRGKLNKDEFAVAMHLVYRRLNGYDIPLRLPPELIPPSTKYLQDSVDTLKNSLKGGSAKKATTPAQPTPASKFKHNDNDVGYVSNSRHRSRRPTESSVVQTSKSGDLTVQDLKKLIREKQILLDAMDLEDQHGAIAANQMNDSNYREIEALKSRIRATQEKLNSYSLGGNQAEKAQLLETLTHHTKDKVPSLMARIYNVNNEIAKANAVLAKVNIKRQHPNWEPEGGEESIVGTGPNGEVTDSDRRKYKSKQLLRQRMAALTGKAPSDDNKDIDLKYKQEVENAYKQSELQSQMTKDIETSIKELEEGAAIYLQVSVKTETGSRKWDNGEGLNPTMKAFINELRSLKKEDDRKPSPSQQVQQPKSTSQLTALVAPAVPKNKPAYTTPEERSAYIKAQAEKRMNERLAKLGISRNKSSASLENEAPKAEPVVKSPVPATPQAPVPQEKVVEKLPEPVEKAPPQQVKQEQQAVEKKSLDPIAPSSDDEEDAEYAALLKQKQEMEARKKERDLKRKQEKEARLAKLKKEMEAMENDGWSDEENIKETPLYNPGSLVEKTARASEPKPDVAKPDVPKPDVATTQVKNESAVSPEQPVSSSAPHKSNPFARFGNGSQAAQSPLGNNTNPFFKAAKKEDSIDQKKMEAQRESQRGMGSEDWSDEEDKSSDDEDHNRAGAAKLASLLFGGAGPQPLSRHTTGNPQQGGVHQSQPSTSSATVPPAPVATQTAQSALNPEPPAVEANVSDDDTDSSNDEFATPSPPLLPSQPASLVPPIPSAPPLPFEAPPIPGVPSMSSGSIPSEAPPLPNEAPPLPTGAPPIPTGAPPIPSAAPPGPPPPPSFFGGAPPPPPPPNMNGGASSPPSGGAPSISALLGQITGGKSLRKVDDSEKKISESSVVGRVL